MSDQEIYQKIEDTYNSQKGKNFITHLLRSFMPMHKSSRMFSNDRKLNLVDCITGEKLCDVNYHLSLVASDEGVNAMMDNLRETAKAMVDKKDEFEEPESVKELRSKVRPVAVTCEGSDKVMTEQTLEQLYNFYATQILTGNRHINWVANNEMGKTFRSKGKELGYIKTKKEDKVVKKVAEKGKMTLGDLEVLQQLKDRMENEK